MRRVGAIFVGAILVTAIAATWTSCGGDPGHVAPPPALGPPAAEPRAAPRARAAAEPLPAPEEAIGPAPASPLPAGAAKHAREPSREITVFVSDEAGTPIEDVLLYFDEDESGKGGTGTTDDEGVVRFSAAAGPRRVETAPRPVPGRCLLPSGTVSVGASETEVRIRLREGVAIEGHVVDEKDQPVPAACVWALGPGDFRNSVTAGPDGEFRVAVPVGSVCELRIGTSTPQWWPDQDLEGSLDRVRAGSTGVVLQCRRIPHDRKLSVLVVDPDGSPLSGAYVAIVVGSLVAAGNADANGRCQLVSLPGRQVNVIASSVGAGARDVYAHSRLVPVVPEGQEVVVQLRRANCVNVALVDASGTAVAERVPVSARNADGETTGGGTDSNGRVVLRMPADAKGSWHVFVVKEHTPNGLHGEADVTVPTDTDLRLVVERR